MNTNTNKVISDDELELSFNTAVEDLRKSLGDTLTKGGEDHPAGTRKSKDKKFSDMKRETYFKSDDEDDEDDEDEDAGEEESEEEAQTPPTQKSVKKSLFDELATDEDADVAGAIDVAPFLGKLAKSLDRRLEEMNRLVRAQGQVQLMQAEMQKSLKDTTEKIAQTPVPTAGLKRLEKSRFEQDGEAVEVTGQDVLMKSIGWLQSNKIDLVEAGNIERRANRGSLFTTNDVLDQKIKALLREDK